MMDTEKGTLENLTREVMSLRGRVGILERRHRESQRMLLLAFLFLVLPGGPQIAFVALLIFAGIWMLLSCARSLGRLLGHPGHRVASRRALRQARRRKTHDSSPTPRR